MQLFRVQGDKQVELVTREGEGMPDVPPDYLQWLQNQAYDLQTKLPLAIQQTCTDYNVRIGVELNKDPKNDAYRARKTKVLGCIHSVFHDRGEEYKLQTVQLIYILMCIAMLVRVPPWPPLLINSYTQTNS